MTLKQDMLAREVLKKENIGKPLREIATKVGYSKTAGNIYNKALKSRIFEALQTKGISRESITDVLSTLGNLARNKGDITNSLRAVEDISKLHNLMSPETNITINQANVLDSIRAVDRAETTQTCTTHKSATQMNTTHQSGTTPMSGSEEPYEAGQPPRGGCLSV
jgi:hypothetical protein